MQKIKIRLPATLTNFSPGLHSLGLAIALHTQVEIQPRSDHQLLVETDGIGAGHYALSVQHPVVQGMSRVFQHLERAPTGITVRVNNAIPLHVGLGAEAAFMAAGVIGANNLMGNPFKRDDLITFAAQASEQPDNTITSMVGGLTAYLPQDERLVYRRLPMQPFKVVLAVPDVPNFRRLQLKDNIASADALRNIQQIPILLEAFREGDIKLIAQVLRDNLLADQVMQKISGYDHIAEVARRNGALAITSSGAGPALIFVTENDHDALADVIKNAFDNLNTSAQVSVLALDTQGIVISMMQLRA